MPTKYHSRKVVTSDGDFDSKKEYRRWLELKAMEKAGRISDLERQVCIELIPCIREPDVIGKRGGRKPGKVIERKASYIADFVYVEDGRKVIEDCKGVRTKDYILKRKLLLWRYGIRVIET